MSTVQVKGLDLKDLRSEVCTSLLEQKSQIRISI